MRPRAALVAVAVAAAVLWIPSIASARCHIAAFTTTQHSVGEGAGQVTLTVHLLGGLPDCFGTVRYQTVDDTAKAPADYTARSGELSFTANDDRRESFTIPIRNDLLDEPSESFTVTLGPGSQPGTITGYGDPAAVTISDDDAPPPQTSQPPQTTSPPTQTPATGAAPTQTQTSVTPEPTPTPSPTPSEEPGIPASPTATAGGTGGSAAPFVAVGVVVALGGLVGWILWRRSAGRR